MLSVVVLELEVLGSSSTSSEREREPSTSLLRCSLRTTSTTTTSATTSIPLLYSLDLQSRAILLSSSITHWLWIDRSDPIRSNNITKMDHEILQQLELLCEREAKHEDPTGEARERLLRLQSTLEYLPQCRLLLEQSESPYALLWASTSMAKMMIERWSAVHNDAVRRALSLSRSLSLSRARGSSIALGSSR